MRAVAGHPTPKATPLAEVTFVVLDLETTGGAAHSCEITEVGAVKLRGGQEQGRFETPVDPGASHHPQIVHRFGLTEVITGPAPPMSSVLPALLEFIGDGVIVGHNIPFDLAFLRAGAQRLGYPPLSNDSVDTCMLARRLVRDEVDDCRLSTLARRFDTAVTPCHRAMADAEATAELLHHLLERTAAFGATHLDDLLALPSAAAHPQAAKLRWVAALPRSPGVYLFRDGAGTVLSVGSADDLRARVRDHFTSADGRHVGPLLREAQRLEHIICSHRLEADVLAIRLQHQHRPRYDEEVKRRGRRRFVSITSTGAACHTRVTSTPIVARDGLAHLGPVASPALARALATVVRQCTKPGDDIADAALSELRRRLSDGQRPNRPDPDPTALEQLVEALEVQRRVERLMGRERTRHVLDGMAFDVDHGQLVSAPGSEAATSAPPQRPGSAAAHYDEAMCLESWLERS